MWIRQNFFPRNLWSLWLKSGSGRIDLAGNRAVVATAGLALRDQHLGALVVVVVHTLAKTPFKCRTKRSSLTSFATTGDQIFGQIISLHSPVETKLSSQEENYFFSLTSKNQKTIFRFYSEFNLAHFRSVFLHLKRRRTIKKVFSKF